MKHLGWLLLLLTASPLWSADNRKITIQELKNLMAADQSAKKSDDEVALDLKQVTLTEELSIATKDSLAGLTPGPHSTEQLFALEARSALLLPPAADLPATAAPDAAAQQAILAKAADYLSKYYSHLPHLTATKSVARFQDGVEGTHSDNSMHSSISANGNILRDQSSLFVRLVSLKSEPTESDAGVEAYTAPKGKLPWGANGIVASIGPALPLNETFQEATTFGNPKFLRWESVNGKPAAVFSFSVEKKKSHYVINYCCFPDVDANSAIDYGMSKGAPPPPSGLDSAKSSADWKPFKANAAFQGTLFIDPDTGAIVRTITQVDFKGSELVRSEAQRTDYERIPVGDKSLVAVARTYTLATLTTGGENSIAKSPLRHTFVIQSYKDYQLAK
jgi:hypothetical protein